MIADGPGPRRGAGHLPREFIDRYTRRAAHRERPILDQTPEVGNIGAPSGLSQAAEATLSTRVVRGSASIFALQVFARLATLVRVAVLARLLAPSDFGIVGVALVAMSSVRAFTTTGVTVALVQAGSHDRRRLDTGWTLLVLRGATVSLVMVLAAPVIARFFNAPDAVSIIRVMAVAPLLEGATNIGLVELQRSFTFGRYLVVEACGPLAELVVAVGLGLWMRNAWALVGGWLALWSVRLAVSYAVHPFRPRLHLDRAWARNLLAYGRWVSASTATSWTLSEGVNGLVGRVLGVEALGFYRTARPLGMLPTSEVAGLLSWVTVAAYARLRDDAARVRSAFGRVLGAVAVFVLPAATLVVLLGPTGVEIVLGRRWAPIGPLVQAFAVLGLFRSVTALETALFQGVGRPALQTRASAVELSVVVAAMLWLMPWLGAPGVAIASAIGACAGTLDATRGVRQAGGVPFKDVFTRVARPAIACAPGFAVTLWLQHHFAGIPLVFVSVPAFLASYLLLLSLIERAGHVTDGLAGVLKAIREVRAHA